MLSERFLNEQINQRRDENSTTQRRRAPQPLESIVIVDHQTQCC